MATGTFVGNFRLRCIGKMREGAIMKTLEEAVGKEKTDTLVKCMDYLARRWGDESEYEDFAEYREYFEKTLGQKVASFTKRPFRAVFDINGRYWFIQVNKSKIVTGLVGDKG